MSQKNTPETAAASPVVITSETAQQAAELVQSSLRLLAEQSQQMNERLQQFNARNKAAQETIQRGGYRTSGRIV